MKSTALSRDQSVPAAPVLTRAAVAAPLSRQVRAFGVSAVAGYISPSTGQLHNAGLANLGTFIGALCFLAGALLLMPERTEDTIPAVTTPAPSGT